MTSGRVNPNFRLEDQGISGLGHVHYNLLEPALIEAALKRGEGHLGNGGTFLATTGKFTGRSPKDKHVVKTASVADTIWWDNNRAMSPEGEGLFSFEVRPLVNGQERQMELQAHVRFSGQGSVRQPERMFGMLVDHTENRRMQAALSRAQRQETVGRMAGMVAHDFNNILTAIIGYCDLMLLRHQPGDGDYDDIQQIKNNSNRAASLTRQLLAFSRQQTLRPQILQLANVVADVSSLLKRLLGETVRLEVHHGRGVGAVRADPGQLEQVIINLGVNARDAMPKGGVVHISTLAVGQQEVAAMGSEFLPIGDYVKLSVEDSGVGISKENLSKIFEPFFTTKELGHGTGLGLSTVYGIVKQSGGFIFADSTVGRGTRFDIFLPVHQGEAPFVGMGKKEFYKPKDLWGSGRVLIVEDEDMVRAVAERALVRQGYVVETASDGEQALELFAEGKRYDLVVSDVVMPNMDGPTMARNLRATYGDIRLLFMSGYAEEQLRETISLDNVSFLAKPFSVQQIAEAVHDALVKAN